jgi:CRP/FNR family cyclic AMP-dependent transcriptional regulator
MALARIVPPRPRLPASLIASPLFLSESVEGLADGADFLNALSPSDRLRVRAAGTTIRLAPGENVFIQGEPHRGIFIIESGRVRVFFTGPSGREVTLAYWTQGNFIGGPSIRCGGQHQWSCVAIEPTVATALSAASLKSLIQTMPGFAFALIEGLEAKGRCYTAMAQMLGTRSVIARLAQLVLNLGELYGVEDASGLTISGMLSHDEIAALAGSTRQWVTMMLKRFRRDGVIEISGSSLTIKNPRRLLEITSGDG